MACRRTLIAASLAVCWRRRRRGRKARASPPASADPGRRCAGKISKCGGGICGIIVSLREPIDPATGRPQVDNKNPNPALRSRPIVGLPLFFRDAAGSRPANGRARSTTPTTAAPMPAASRWRAPTPFASKLRRRALRLARPGRTWAGEAPPRPSSRHRLQRGFAAEA